MRFVDYPFKVTYNVFVEVSEKKSSEDAHILLLLAYFLFSKMLCVEKMLFWWKIYQTLKKRKRAHIVFSIIRPFLYCLQQKRILSYYVLIALNIWWMLVLNKNEIKFKHIIKLYYISYLCVIFNASKQLL